MSSLESMLASSGEAPVHPALNYELPAVSTAIVDRKQHCRAYPSSASSLNLANTRTCRIRLGGEDFIDVSSIRLMFTVKNDHATTTNYLNPTTGPWGVWQQCYLRSGGQEIDNIPFYNRWHTQYGFNQLTRAEQFGSVGAEGWHMSKVDPNGTFRPDIGDIPGGGSITVMHRLHFSVFSAGKLWPVKFAPLEIEMSLCNEPSDWLVTTGDGISTAYTLSDVQILYNSVTLDEAVQNSLYSALLANKVLSVGTMGCYQICHPIPAGSASYSFSSVRAFSRLAQVWLTFRATGPRASQFICPGDLPGDSSVSTLALVNKAVPQARLSIGPHTWPGQQPAASAAEYYYMMINALGTQPNITRRDFEHDCFTIVWDLCRTPQNPQSSVSTRSGELVRVELNGLSGAGASGAATECWMTLIDYQIVAIRESGVTLLT
jgi:hypothetical protein